MCVQATVVHWQGQKKGIRDLESQPKDLTPD